MKGLLRRVTIGVLLLIGLFGPGSADAAAQDPPAPRIVRLDPRFDRLVPRDAVIERIASGFSWVEGPVWSRAGGTCCSPMSRTTGSTSGKPGEGVGVFLDRSGYTGEAPFMGLEPGSNGLAFDGEGRLVFCQHGDRAISRLDANGRRSVLVDRYNGARINSPNYDEPEPLALGGVLHP